MGKMEPRPQLPRSSGLARKSKHNFSNFTSTVTDLKLEVGYSPYVNKVDCLPLLGLLNQILLKDRPPSFPCEWYLIMERSAFDYQWAERGWWSDQEIKKPIVAKTKCMWFIKITEGKKCLGRSAQHTEALINNISLIIVGRLTLTVSSHFTLNLGTTTPAGGRWIICFNDKREFRTRV